jgi:hypothetical protein
MNAIRHLLAIGLLAFAVQAQANWVDDTVDEVIDKVRAIWTTVTGDVKDTAADLKRQLTALEQQGDTLKETVTDVLGLLQHRRKPFQDFVNGGTERCGEGSPCWDFRMDLEIFVLDMADLKSKFPQIERQGLGNGELLAEIIDHVPPLILFAIYETLRLVPDWQATPQNLANLFDQIGDADAFSAEPLGASPAIAPTDAGVRAKAAFFPFPPTGQAVFGSPVTKTHIFCSKGKQLRDDPVKLNRVRAGWTWVSNMLDGLAEFSEEDVTVELVGEGGSVPVVIKGVMKSAAKVIESIFASVDAYRANLGLCKQVETDVAQSAMLVDYRTAYGVATAYWVVRGVMNRPSMASIDKTTANSRLDEAGNLYGQATPDYIAAYGKICAAYTALFCSGFTGSGGSPAAFPACK